MRCVYKIESEERCIRAALQDERVCEVHYRMLDDCSICFEKLDLKKEHVTLAPCKHEYHLHCIHEYYMFVIKKKDAEAHEFVCPMCKQRVDSKTKGVLSRGSTHIDSL